MPYLVNGAVEIHHQIPHEIDLIHDQFLGLEPELLILHEMVSVLDISLHVSRVPTLLVQIYCLAILHLRHNLDSSMCGDF